MRYPSDLYHWPGVADTVDFIHIKHHYYVSHRRINPTGILPLADLDLDQPAERGKGYWPKSWCSDRFL